MFWYKWFHKTDRKESQKPRLKPPTDLPQSIGRYLVVNLEKDPDWVWSLKAVWRTIEGGKKSARHFRVYDPAQSATQGINIENYNSLDSYSELILYAGDYDKDSLNLSLIVHEPKAAA
jgi:hypothetical protein